MNQNIKIAKELVRIAKLLISSNNKEYNLLQNENGFGQSYLDFYVTGINEFQFEKILDDIKSKLNLNMNFNLEKEPYVVIFPPSKNKIYQTKKEIITFIQKNGFTKNDRLRKMQLNELDDEERNKYEEEKIKGKEKEAFICYENRCQPQQIWISLEGVTSKENKQVQKYVYDECIKKGLDYVEMKDNKINFRINMYFKKASEHDEPFKTMKKVLQEKGFNVKIQG